MTYATRATGIALRNAAPCCWIATMAKGFPLARKSEATEDTSVISASQWAEALGEALRDAARAQAPDNMETYYNAVLSALETLLQRSGIVGAHEAAARKAQWERAYRNTPHGQPVALRAGEK